MCARTSEAGLSAPSCAAPASHSSRSEEFEHCLQTMKECNAPAHPGSSLPTKQRSSLVAEIEGLTTELRQNSERWWTSTGASPLPHSPHLLEGHLFAATRFALAVRTSGEDLWR